MKKIVLWVSVLVLSVITFSSCCTTRVSSVTRVTEPLTGGVLADLDIRTEKITHTYEVVIKNSIMTNEEELKMNAVFEALKNVGADVLVAPQFKVTRTVCQFKATYEVVVTGYPAYFVNFKQKSIGEKLELRELKEGASYIIVKKTSDNNDVEYDNNIIRVTEKTNKVTFDVNESDLDHVVFTGKGKRK